MSFPAFATYIVYRFANIHVYVYTHILQYGTGSAIAIIRFAVWPDLPIMQSLNHAIKNPPTRMVVRGSVLCAHLIRVVWTADKIKEFGHWIRCGVGDLTLPGSCVEKVQHIYMMCQSYDQTLLFQTS